ncbi:heme biosynthesis protein HemY [Aestuariibacter halophilus]|uniref:Heme biosynthesis protein HemY n=1 Tax=Fluctibacter halophilus TaxID=226011 RepID=A0ABS8GAB8_9ALTE|nr:heme biosynthesis HemY N-terminal domain-containing protein [Aestuariibacter halophilus]MCC2617537.1 heme biosynthesis protein HemY [Aestuariibacter halophilus]
MRKVTYLLAFLGLIIAGLLLGPLAVNYDGYVLIVMEHGTVQLRIFGVLLLLLIVGLATWLLLLVARVGFRTFGGSKDWLFNWSARKRRRAFRDGLLALAAGNYEASRKSLEKLEDGDEFDGINLIAQGEVCMRTGEPEKAITLWQMATEIPAARLAATLNLVRERLDHRDADAALTLLGTLADKEAAQPPTVNLHAEALAMAGQWQTLQANLPKWKKALGDNHGKWQQRASESIYAEIASKKGARELQETWQRLPRSTRRDHSQRLAFAKQLMEQGKHADAEKTLLEHAPERPTAALLEVMRAFRHPNPTLAMKTLEGWIKSDDTNSTLFSVLGQLALQTGDINLADKAISRAVKLSDSPKDWFLLGQIKEAKHDITGAAQCFKSVSQRTLKH